MKKSIKLLMIAFVILCLTGCSVSDNITLNYDGTVTEDVTILTRIDSKDSKNIIKSIVDSKLKDYSIIMDRRNYKYDYVFEKNQGGARIYKDYNDVCSYFQGSYFNQYLYKFFDCSEDETSYVIKNATPHIPYCGECAERPALPDVKFNVILPFSATESNADSVDGNKYTWKFDKNTTDDKSIYLKISKQKLEDYKINYEKDLLRKKRNKKIIIISVVLVITVIVGVFFKKYYDKFKKMK